MSIMSIPSVHIVNTATNDIWLSTQDEEKMIGLRDILVNLGYSVDYSVVVCVIKKMYTLFNDKYTATIADNWGIRFFNDLNTTGHAALMEAAQSDATDFVSHPSLASFVTSRQEALAPNRLSTSRVMWLSDWVLSSPNLDPLFDHNAFHDDQLRLLDFAQNGVEIVVDDDFVPCNSWGRLSASYQEASHAVNAMLYSSWLNGLLLFLPKDIALQIPGLHLQRNGWAPKAGKEKGRPTHNCSNSALGGPCLPLNTIQVKDKAAEKWGKIVLPTVVDIVNMILRARDKFGPLYVVLHSTDINGAFNLLFFLACLVQLMAFQMDCDVVAISVAGNFGWTGMPAAFQVISRFLQQSTTVLMNGESLVYVDDILCCSSKDSWLQDREITSQVITGLLGDGAEAVGKRMCTEDTPDRSIVCLGWLFSLSNWTVDVAEKNRYNALYWFWVIDLDKPISMQSSQRICSLAHRYSLVYKELAVLLGGLNDMLGGMDRVSKGSTRVLSEEAMFTIRVWRAYLVLSEVQSLQGLPRGRSMEILRSRPPSYLIEFDGSLKGVGVRLFSLSEDGVESLVFMSGCLIDFNIDNSPCYQNAMELAALVYGLGIAKLLNWNKASIKLRGDSMTVLHWASHGNFRVSHGKGVLLVMLLLLESMQCSFDSSVNHLLSEDNYICDELSRRGYLSDGPPNDEVVSPLYLHPILAWCDPVWSPRTDHEFTNRLVLIRDHISSD